VVGALDREQRATFPNPSPTPKDVTVKNNKDVPQSMRREAPNTSITIKTTAGDRYVVAYVFGAWAVHEHWDAAIRKRHRWAITHVRSGLAIPDFYTENLSKLHALRSAMALNDGFGDVDPGNEETGKQMAELIWKVALGMWPIVSQTCQAMTASGGEE
jgi:hypothetical protein